MKLSDELNYVDFFIFYCLLQYVVNCVLTLYFLICYRGFGFITFGDPASVDKVLAQATHELDGKKVNSKSSIPSFINRC